MKLSKARNIIWGIMAAVVMFGIMSLCTQSPIMYILMFLALVAELIVFCRFIRCPHCGHHLDRAGMNVDIEFCPFCGKELE